MSADTENSSNSMDVQDAEMSPVVEKATAGNAVVSDDSGKKRKKSVAEKGLKAAGGGSKKGSGSKKARKSMAGRDEGEDEEDDEDEEDVEMDLDATGDYGVYEDEAIDDGKKAGGIIQYIYVENFMNHKKMEVILNPSLTFITGKNGSGKSAIATALMICLGSRASTTGRGSSLRGLIMEGSNGNAKIRVALKNSGDDAYEPHLYGKTIVVERTITRSGGSTLALKNSSKLSVAISTKRADLDRILSRFDIRVDNPCCVLTQENSKKFIKGKEEDKYDFFMKATGLKPMYDELTDLKDTFEDSKKTFKKSEGRVQQLKVDRDAKKADYQSMEDMETIENKIRMQHAKAFWIDVYEKQEILTEMQGRSDSLEEAAKSAKEELTAEEEAVASAGNNKAQLKADLEEAISGVQTLEENMEDNVKAYQEVQKQKKNASKLEKELQSKVNDYEERKATALEELEEMMSRVKGNADGEKKELYEKIAKIEKEIEKITGEMGHLEEDHQEAVQALRDQQKGLNHFNKARDGLKRDLQILESDLRDAKSGGAADEVLKFTQINPRNGKQLYSAYKAIQADGQLRGKLVGPIGTLLSLKPEYKNYSGAVHIAMNGLEGAFINVSGDAKVMYRGLDVLRSKGVRAEIINQPRSRRYNAPTPAYSDGNPTLIEALSIEHEDAAVRDLIFNVLIDRKRAQGTLIVGKEDADITKYVVKGPDGRDRFKDENHKACVAADSGATVSFSRGTRSYVPFKGQTKKYLNVSKDMNEAIKDIEDAIEDKRAEIRDHEASKPRSGSDSSLQRAEGAIKSLQDRLRVLRKGKNQIAREISDLEDNSKEEDPTELQNELAELNNAMEQAAHRKEEQKERSKQIAEEHKKLKEVVTKMEGEKEELVKTRDAKEEQLKQEMDRSRDAESRLHRLKKAAEQKGTKAAGVKEALDKQNAEYEALEEDVKSKTREMLDKAWDGEPLKLESSETREKLKKRADKLKVTLEKQREDNKVSGLTLEIAAERYIAAKAAHREAKESREILEGQLIKIGDDLKERKSAFRTHRGTCAKRVNTMFCTYLEKKGFNGEAVFEHTGETEEGKMVKGKLLMSVNKDGGDAADGASDIRNLSGGERSFTTLALLLALGHVVDTPFRVMDEYDVFLDELSRTLTLTQIQDYAKDVKQSKKQFIVITPNSLKGIRTGNTTKVVKMADPERRQAHGLQQSTID